ncbi:MAG: hypothetical protein KDD61_13130 [Bdellovibrionales bacterium]|nr:hypothetical protein [Bdellovibrionales bacterium]
MKLGLFTVKVISFIELCWLSEIYDIEIYFMNFGEVTKSYPNLSESYEFELWDSDKYKLAKKTFWAYVFTPIPGKNVLVIQVSDNVFKNFYTVDPRSGLKNLPTGTGFPQLAHELLHAALFMNPEIPEENHHCMFVEDGLLKPALEFLVSKNLLGGGTMNFKLHGEYKNCLRGRNNSKRSSSLLDSALY